MAEGKTYQKDAVVFRQGDAGNCMYCLEYGKAGVYSNYGKPDEVKLAELESGALFGEMSLLDNEPRSATVVVLENDTVISEISESTFRDYFDKSPEVLLDLSEKMSHRLRETTRKYVEACRTVKEAVDTEKAGSRKSEGLIGRIRDLCEAYVRSLRA